MYCMNETDNSLPVYLYCKHIYIDIYIYILAKVCSASEAVQYQHNIKIQKNTLQISDNSHAMKLLFELLHITFQFTSMKYLCSLQYTIVHTARNGAQLMIRKYCQITYNAVVYLKWSVLYIYTYDNKNQLAIGNPT